MSGGFGRSSQQSTATQSRETFVDPAQQPYLDAMRGMGLDLARSQGQDIGSASFGRAGELEPYANTGIANLAQISGGAGAGFDTLGRVANAGPGAGQQTLYGLTDPGVTGAQIDVLGRRLGDFYNERLVPGMREGAIGAGGQLGGSRDQLGRATAAGDVADAFTAGATDIMQRDLTRRGTAAAQLGELELGQLGTQAGAGQAMLSERLRASAALPQGLDQAFGMTQAPFAAQFAPLLALSQLIGDPTILATGMARQQSSGEEFNLSFGS